MRFRSVAAAAGMMSLLLLPVRSAPVSNPVIVRSGVSAAHYFGAAIGLVSLYTSWTQTVTYTGVSISATLCSDDGSSSSANWYLTNRIGAGTSPGNGQVAAGTVTGVTALCSADGASTPITSGLTLPPGTYYLVFGNFSAHFNWSLSNTASEQLGAGVTSNVDNNDVASPSPGAYPPASIFFTPDSPPKALLFAVAVPATTIPALSDWALAGTALLLLAAGLCLLRLRAKHS